MDIVSNPQLELAFDYVSQTNKHIFLTGKAGTGKTTFLRRVRREVIKRMAVVAPTGVAAINAEGVTIHSLFQLPFGPLVPGQVDGQISRGRFSRQKITLIKSLDLLVIDEISMVRADVLDAIDRVLRRYRDFSRPFGGLQLLMIGDLHQLPPVVKSDEWELLKGHYQTPYFFGSLSLQKTDAVTIELKHIFRQADSEFIEILNKVRNNRMDAKLMEVLNSRYQPAFRPDEAEAFITLTSHNATAKKINREKLSALAGDVYTFTASIDGDFPPHAYPTEEELVVKVDAQVMFVKNDLGEDKRYYNGKIGRISRIKKDLIYVRCPDDDKDIVVGRAEWHNRKYSLDESSKEVKEELIGTFTQYPLKLAWAITIHKSQGLTFERVIIDAQAAFAHGQVYVALSRCKTFEGIVLRTPLIDRSIKTDMVVKNYTEEAQQNEPGAEELLQAKRAYQQDLLCDFFLFKILQHTCKQFRRAILENEYVLHGNAVVGVENLAKKIQKQVFGVGKTFLPQLDAYLSQTPMPAENEELNTRLRKAGAYFSNILEELLREVKELDILTDNKEVRKKVKEKGEAFKKELFMKAACAKALSEGFDSHTFAKVAVDAELDYQQVAASKPSRSKAPQHIEHPALYDLLTQWRRDTAEDLDVKAFQVLTTRSLLEVATVLPTSMSSLRRIHGIGKNRAKQFGQALIELVTQYCREHQLKTDLLTLSLPESDTKAISLALFRKGKNTEEIAKERKLAVSTIENHLAFYVERGELDVFELLESEKVEEIVQYFAHAESANLSEAKDHFGQAYSYGQLRLARAYMKLGHSA